MGTSWSIKDSLKLTVLLCVKLHLYIHTCTYMHMYIRTTYVHTNTHTYIRTYTHTISLSLTFHCFQDEFHIIMEYDRNEEVRLLPYD